MTLNLLATIFETIVLCFICFTALIGNASLFLIVYKNQNLFTVTNTFILNLAAADILVSVLSMPVTMVTIIAKHWVFGHSVCVALGYLTILSFIASVMSLGMIAINRYFHVVKWSAYTSIFSKKKASIYVVAVWVVSTSLASPPLFGWTEYRFIPGKSCCFVYWPSNVYFMYFMIIVCFMGPLLVIAFSYYNILVFTREAKRKIAVSRNNLPPPQQRQPHRDAAQEEPKATCEVQNKTKADIELKCNKVQFRVTTEEARITNTFLLMVTLFVVCWSPLVVTMFLDVYYTRPLARAVDISSLLLGYANSAVNPILYGVRNSAFKQGFLKLYSRFLPVRFRPANVI